MSREILEPAFELIVATMKRAAAEKSVAIAEAEAKRHGLIELGDGTPSQLYNWERKVDSWTLAFTWRWYDLSKAFSIQPDMNIMSLKLADREIVVRREEERYED
ncbi:hypothetical protein BQ8794_570004 [Mesorhizobium prunaredense]|uniref:Uncharacterized protein n=1 Tax=Mesorhizobium prunaredense TaxID=1631249 RepID=A0A1R3VJQ7_9HYPH|nr:hypothetical protein [Mesorhizobium prunaredense]SIT58682.1 hypothetical protein BQ8794_570004 [Mesorhizobium prunaredense]